MWVAPQVKTADPKETRVSKQYRKIALTLVIRSDAAEQVRNELEQAADLIAIDNLVYGYRIDDRHSRKPANAGDYEVDLDDDED
jgi:hypothetical protein